MSRKMLYKPPLTFAEILAWADAHREWTGKWPSRHSGPVRGNKSETWGAVARALEVGNRGLPGGSSLAQLLALRRGKRYRPSLAPLTKDQILGWANAHY